MIDEKELKTIPYVAYLAHPYGGKESNITDSVVVAKALRDHYPNLIIVNPLTNLSYMQGEEESKILECCKELLISCDFLILSDGWEHSPGCNEEFKEALKHDMDVLAIEKDEKGCIQLVNFENEPSTPKAQKWEDVIDTAVEGLKQDDDLKFLVISAIGREREEKVPNSIALKVSGTVPDIVNNAVSTLGKIACRVARTLGDCKVPREVFKATGIDVANPAMQEVLAQSLLTTAADNVKEEMKGFTGAANHVH